jgi:hypothetical protein
MTLIKRALCASLLLLGSTAFAAGTAPAVKTLRVYAFDVGYRFQR